MSYNCGEVVMKCKPFVHTLNEREKSNRCDYCFKLKESLLKCSNCKKMYYCDRKCQKEDWNQWHKRECNLYLKNYDNCLNRDCERFLLRLWLFTHSSDESIERQTKSHELPNGLNRCFDDLMTHSMEILKDSKRMKYFNEMIDRFNEIGFEYNYEIMFQLFCKICINSFTILNEDLNQIGSALYICGSVLNHSCEPNAATIFNGIDLEVRALKPIAANEGIYINYLDLKMSGTDRRTRLREQYYFDCNCVKCSTDSDNTIDYSLVKHLDQEFDELISNQNDWEKCYLIGLESIRLYEQIYGDFHPDLTVQLMRVMKVKVLITDDLKEKNTLDLIRKTKDSIQITHGFDNSLFKLFKKTIGF